MKIKKNIIIMYIIAFLHGMVFYGAVATLYRQAVGVSLFQIAIIESISLALAFVLEIPWGVWADKIGYKNTMVFCCILYFISKVIFWRADSFAMFLVERIFLSIVMAGMSGVDTSILYLSSEEGQAHRVFGIHASLQSLGLMTASALYSFFMNGDYRLAAFATMVSYGIALIAVLFLQEVRENQEKSDQVFLQFKEVVTSILHKKELFLFLISIALFSECHQMITVFLNQLQYKRAGMTNQMIAWVYVAVTISGLLGVKSASIGQRLGQRNSGVLFFIIAITSCFTISITQNPWISVMAVLMLRITYSMLMPLAETIQNEQVFHKNRATALSINAIIMDGVAITTNLIIGKVADISLAISFYLCTCLCIIGVILYLYSMTRLKREKLS